MAMFIRIDVNDDVVRDAGVAGKLIETCPVKIFAAGADDKSVVVIDDNVDECTLCDLCEQACPGGVKVVKLY
ncbi:MAG: NAD-dependent dihydropyrimidine dehydrogenase PreA subunit [Hyphomicrobiaceae bacterium]|jgi:NAD-dependent dihydropyrimidine dehydrogenase PreA subunit